ncbi:hypothetical protein NQ315_002803 [Exocentrus adspersus]|uniref:Peptidase aspartic putative domain-containing protein n=1 Tax=Exocentrus adspersus TaxID=1586481 RepID=A0AAV8VKF4_9CUCU|nr:hypothetical protein NQ315_002803 [Exocentrus adspersus]
MKSRFGREDLQIEVYIRELLKLILNNTTQQNFEIASLYDNLETQLRSLETLGITMDKYAAILFPLIESCLPEDLLRIWQRSTFNTTTNHLTSNSTDSLIAVTLDSKLKNIMRFLQLEVENEQRINLVEEGFGQNSYNKLRSRDNKKQQANNKSEYTAAGLVNTDVGKCIFCEGITRPSFKCFKARKLSIEERKRLIKDHKACFRCLKVGLVLKNCRSSINCNKCKKPHASLICNQPISNQSPILTSQVKSQVVLQTLKVSLIGVSSNKIVRALIDTGSQKSYILKSTALTLGLKPKRMKRVRHCLFGGIENTENHNCYDVSMYSETGINSIEVLDKVMICNDITPIIDTSILKVLTEYNIEISDVNGTSGPIELLIGADFAGTIYTGKSFQLNNGLLAMETKFGWTLMRSITTSTLDRTDDIPDTMSVLSLFVNPSIAELWQMDVLGIEEPTEKLSKEERAQAAEQFFLQT